MISPMIRSDIAERKGERMKRTCQHICLLAAFILSFGFLKLVGRRAFNQED